MFSSVQFIFAQHHIMVHEVHDENNIFTYIQYSCKGQESKWGEETV